MMAIGINLLKAGLKRPQFSQEGGKGLAWRKKLFAG